MVKAGNIQQIINHMVFSHQSTLVRNQIMKNGFNLQWRLAADYNFLLDCFLRGRIFAHVGIPMSLVDWIMEQHIIIILNQEKKY